MYKSNQNFVFISFEIFEVKRQNSLYYKKRRVVGRGWWGWDG
jgi:hypothetical protein